MSITRDIMLKAKLGPLNLQYLGNNAKSDGLACYLLRSSLKKKKSTQEFITFPKMIFLLILTFNIPKIAVKLRNTGQQALKSIFPN